jgi:transposase-like protein
MDVHENARTTRHSRMLMVQRLASGGTPAAVAQALGVTARTVRKWRDRFAAAGAAGLADRSSRPHRSPTRLGGPANSNVPPISYSDDVMRCLRENGHPELAKPTTVADGTAGFRRLRVRPVWCGPRRPSGAQGTRLDEVARGTAAGPASASVPGEMPIADSPRALRAISLPVQ